MARIAPLALTALVLAALLAGCSDEPAAAAYRDPPAIAGQPSGSFAGAADGNEPGCDASLDGTSGFTLCGVRFTQADGRFTVAGLDEGARPMQWSDLRLRAANANLAVMADDPQAAMLLDGDVPLGSLHGGRVAEGDSYLVCRSFDAIGPATLMLWDARPIGGAVQQTYSILPCTALPEEVLGEDAPVARTPVTVTLSFDLNVGQAWAQNSQTSINNANCINIPDDLAPWSGKATATWTPFVPTQEELIFGADGGNGLGVLTASGLTLDIPLQPAGGFIGLSPPDPGAAMNQAAKLDVELTVMSDGSGAAGAGIGTGTCKVVAQ